MMEHETWQKTAGLITNDPALTLPHDVALRFVPTTLCFEDTIPISAADNWDFHKGILASIQFSDGTGYSIEGSAVVVGPGIAICASHVFEEHQAALRQGQLAAIAVSLAAGGMQIWRILEFTPVPKSDLCILGLEYATRLPPNNTFFQAVLTARIPEIGEPVTFIGFRGVRESFRRSEDTFRSEGNVLVSFGQVRAIHLGGRDRVMLPFPVLEVQCVTPSGMSGGPVFDSEGKMVGILSTSYSEGPSYASLVSPAFDVPFEGGWPRFL